MNLTKLFEAQRVLDERIEQEHPRTEGENRLESKSLALLVELGEAANEYRGFKFWSTNQEPITLIYEMEEVKKDDASIVRCVECGVTCTDNQAGDFDDCPACCVGTLRVFRAYNPLLEELVDCLHFILSIGNDLEAYTNYMYDVMAFQDTFNKPIRGFNQTYFYAASFAEFPRLITYYDMYGNFINLIKVLGFTTEQLETAYYEKNKINHERQDGGY